LKLALDSTQNSGSIALATGEMLLYSAFFDIRITHSETLMPAIDHAFQFCGVNKKDLEAIYVCRGPGSFTGLRIGLATAKGIAFGLSIPLYAYSSLELTALSASRLGKPILVAIDAKMKEVYYAAYSSDLQELIPPQAAKPECLHQLDLDDFILCGSGAGLLQAGLLESGHSFFTLNPALQLHAAAGLFSLAELLPEKHVPQDLAELEPLYIRESTAQVKNLATKP